MPTICQSVVKPFKHKGSVFLPNTVFLSSDVILCDTCLLHPHYQHSPATAGLWWILHTLVITQGGRRASAQRARWSPLASLWRSLNQMSYAAHSWSLFISKTKALSATSCLPSMSQRGESSVFNLGFRIKKGRNRIKTLMLQSEYVMKIADILYSMLMLRSSQRNKNFQRSCKPGQKLENTRLRNRGVAAVRMQYMAHTTKIYIFFCCFTSGFSSCLPVKLI